MTKPVALAIAVVCAAPASRPRPQEAAQVPTDLGAMDSTDAFESDDPKVIWGGGGGGGGEHHSHS